MECEDSGEILEESDMTGIFTTLKINCETCDKAHDITYNNRYIYLKRKYEGEKEEAKKESNISKESDM